MAPKRKEVTKEVETSKKSKKEPVDRRLHEQLKEISGAWGLAPISEEVKQMLTDILPNSLGEFSDQRSKFQDMVVESIAGTLRDAEAALNKAINDARSQRDEAVSGKPLLDKKAQEAAAKLQSAKDDTQRLKVALAEKAIAFRAATALLAEAEEAKKLDAQKSLEAAKQKEHFEIALEDLKVLKVISPEEAEADKKQDVLVKCLKKYKFEESILIALPAALAKAPDARGQFDLMAVAQLEGEICKKVAEQESILVAARPGQEKCEAVVQQMQVRLGEAKADQRTAAKSFDAANKEQAACDVTSVAAIKAVRDLASSSKHFEKGVYSTEVALELFQQGPMGAFNTLRDRTTPPPVVEAAPMVEEEVAAAAAVEEQAMEVQELEAPAVAAC